MKKLIITIIFLLILNESKSQIPFNSFLKCVEILRKSDSFLINKIKNPIFIEVSNDTLDFFSITKLKRRFSNVHLLYRQELFFDKIENNFIIDSFIASSDSVYLILIKNPKIINKLKTNEIVSIELIYIETKNKHSITIKRKF